MIRALVIGFGSIGQRHARVLEELGCEVAVVSRSSPASYRSFKTLSDALSKAHPDYVVIANETSRHHATLCDLAGSRFAGKVMVEKPLFDAWRPLPEHAFAAAAVAYNFRFHPAVKAIKDRLSGQRVLAVECYAGQWLPSWRPNADYRTGYSADQTRGGGVLRDLSHELDLMNWVFGPWTRLAALGGHKSNLEIDSDDVWSILVELESGASLTLQINYLDKPGRRRIVVLTSEETIVGDLVAGTLEINGEKIQYEIDRDKSYRDEHRAMLLEGAEGACSLAEALEVLVTVKAIEHSNDKRQYVARQALSPR